MNLKMAFRRALAGSVLAGMTVALIGGPSCGSGVPVLAPFPATGPYLLNGTGSPDPVQVMAATGARWFTFAFVTAKADHGCRALWNGWEELSATDIEYGRLAAIRALGGDAVIAFGGAGGAKLTQACPSVDALYDQYRRVIELYRPEAIDVDLEDAELTNTADHARLIDVLVRVKENFDVALAVTLPGSVSGLHGPARAFFDTARARGLTVDNWTVMTFDYGDSRYDAGEGRYLTMMEATQRSIEAVGAQVASAYGLTDAVAFRRVGLVSMNGRTDHHPDTGELVTTADFRAMRTYAQQRNLGRFTFWSLNRDRPCTTDEDVAKNVSNQCSHLNQPVGIFTGIAAGYIRCRRSSG